MKLKYSIFLLLVFGIFNAQIIGGKIISSEDQKPIPFAKIGFENFEKLFFSDENGNFQIDFSNIDKDLLMKIEIAGFESYKTQVENFIKNNQKEIELTPKVKEIEAVTISPKKFIDKNLGYNSKSKTILFSYVSKDSKFAKEKYSDEELQKPSVELAVLIKTKKKTKIKAIRINIAEFSLDKSIPARFIIYSEKDGKPDEILNSEDILFKIGKEDIKNNSFTIDVSDKNIWFNGNIFVSFQALSRNFSGIFSISSSILKNSFMRIGIGTWDKLEIRPAINIDVKIEK